ncbi:ladderlectin-like [Pagrus major]|uniref:ladderlectin-like n=1 Tax=Pagrus major TaxID=143350 RepID=UPI003CC8B165
MRAVFLLCAAFALAVSADPVKETKDIQQNVRPGKFEKVETAPVVEEVKEGMLGDVRNICPTGWSQYGSRCFIIINREMTWIDAEKHCVNRGANLASIHNTGEYKFIQDMLTQSTGRLGQTWIGGTDAIRESAWFWSDGSGFNFHLWGIDEPNNSGGNERCIEINRSVYDLWNDMPCEFQFPFVCGTRP